MKGICVFLLFTIAICQLSSAEPEYHTPIFNYGTKNGPRLTDPIEEEQSYWLNNAQEGLEAHLARRIIKNKAKNVIFFIGDGMSLVTIAAARTFEGQSKGKTGEENTLSFEKFPVSGLARTYCIDSQVADSACSATAYLGGVKTNDATIGVSGKVKLRDCEAMNNPDNQVKSILHHALEAAKSAGIVTTTRVTHASPTGAHAHIAHRDWESDANVLYDNVNSTNCRDIAHQLVNKFPGSDFQVIMGGGRKKFLPKTSGGEREDGEDLVQAWQASKEARGFKPQYFTNKTEMFDLKNDTTHILGLFHSDHMDYHLLADNDEQPTLEEMMETAIKVLSKNDEGFFLFVEGGRIDHAHHKTMPRIALDETVEMAKAIQKAVDMVDEEETLIVVSSDHAHAMTLSGYPTRGNDILGTSDTATGSDGIKYLTLSYANGPGYRPYTASLLRPDVTQEDGFTKKDPEFMHPAMVPLSDETHGGEDVAVFAKGPFQHLFTGSYEQNMIPHIMAYAMCIGPGKHACGGASTVAASSLLISLVLFHVFRRITSEI